MLISKFQITIHVEDVTSDVKEDDSIYDDKDTYVLGYSPSKLKEPSLVCIYSNTFDFASQYSFIRWYIINVLSKLFQLVKSIG